MIENTTKIGKHIEKYLNGVVAVSEMGNGK
jgi:hypothetical protein